MEIINMEHFLSKKELNEGMSYLKKLERSGLYVFHGSPDGDINNLEPRQSTHVSNLSHPHEKLEHYEVKPDGEPAVSATPYAEFAIFRALVNSKNIPSGTRNGFGFLTNGEKEFHLSSKEVFESLRGKFGFVYVFKKSDFNPYSRNNTPSERSMEWRSASSVSPTEVVRVSFEDLESILPEIRFIES